MSGRLLTPGSYGFSDLQVADSIETDKAEITIDMIDRFAELTGDRFAIHMSDEAAQSLGFPRRVAHGLLILSVIDGLKNQCPVQLRAVASLGWEWTFRTPVFAMDTVQSRLIVESKRLTRDPARGIVTFVVEVRNQDGSVVQQGRNTLMVVA